MIEATNISNEIIQIYLADGTAKNVRVDNHTTVQRVINVVLNGLGLDTFSVPHFALRLAPAAPSIPGTKLQQCHHWLHPGLRMPQIARKYLRRSNPMPLRFELKIRFIPKDIREMYQTEMSAFLYFYDQLSSDYINHVSWKIETNIATEMGALMLKKRFPNITVSNVEKKLDFRIIENEGGLLKYFPESFVLNVKKKQLQKNIIAAVKKIANYSELECVFRFLNQLMKIVKFDVEIFRVSLGLGWNSPIELHIGEKAGISYKTENSTALIQHAKLRNIVDICIRKLDNSDKAIVRLRISAQANPLILTVPTMSIAESMAHLIDGYQMLLSQQPSLWSVQDLFVSENTAIAKTRRAQTLSPQIQRNHFSSSNNSRIPLTPNFNRGGPTFDQNNYYYSRESNSEDYAKSMISESDIHLDRSSVRLEELIGDGLFGNVYRGSYIDTRLKRHSVAVKVCRVDNNDGTQNLHTSNKFLLEEAYTMQQFRHPHIIKLLGICTGPSISSSDESESDSGTASNNNNNNNDIPSFGVWLVLELAPFGELRQYLQREKAIIDLSVQILFAKQIASAVTYLHSRAFVHRDIAARNVLVTNSRCVKLSDFGMSKLLAEEDVYTSSSGKLPIKWMAPESLNFRKFTTQSDVYSLGICIWEILMYGIKPWQGIRNHEVIKKIEAGELLQRPPECPLALYDMLRAMWVIDEYLRITAIETTHFLEHLLEEIDQGKQFFELTVPDFHTLRKKIDALPKPATPASNGRKKSIPILNVDASEVPFSTLWRAMESQRQQCEEDEKWLEGEEDEDNNEKAEQNIVPSTSTKISPVDDLLPQQQKSSSSPSPFLHEIDRASDSIHEAVLRVVQAVTYLTKTYSTQMTNNEFVEKIKKITNELSSLFSESEKDIQKLNNEDRKKVEMVEALLGADLKNMTKAMAFVVDENEKVKCDYHRRQVLKTAHMLAVNCKNYLDTVDEARIRNGIARLCCKSPVSTPSFC